MGENIHIGQRVIDFPCYSVKDIHELFVRQCPVDESEKTLWERFLFFFVPTIIRISCDPCELRRICISAFKKFREPIILSDIQRNQFIRLHVLAMKSKWFHLAVKSLIVEDKTLES